MRHPCWQCGSNNTHVDVGATGRPRCRCADCSHEWQLNLCSVCHQPRRGHICRGPPASVKSTQLLPKEINDAQGYVSAYASSAHNRASSVRPGYATSSAFAPGMSVEVRMAEIGLVGSSYRATIVQLKATKALVDYETLFVEEAPAETPAETPTAPPAQNGRSKWAPTVEDDATATITVPPPPGQCCTPGCDLAIFHLGPCKPNVREDGTRKRKQSAQDEVDEATPAPTRLREWVPVASLRMPPVEPPSDWLQMLRVGDEVEMRHDGGYWRVVVQQMLEADRKARKGARIVVEVVGYALLRSVRPTELRPRA